VRDKALSYLDDGLAGDKPFFLTVAPIAPHSCELLLCVALTQGSHTTPTAPPTAW
jgi:hypothetical protein